MVSRLLDAVRFEREMGASLDRARLRQGYRVRTISEFGQTSTSGGGVGCEHVAVSFSAWFEEPCELHRLFPIMLGDPLT